MSAKLWMVLICGILPCLLVGCTPMPGGAGIEQGSGGPLGSAGATSPEPGDLYAAADIGEAPVRAELGPAVPGAAPNPGGGGGAQPAQVGNNAVPAGSPTASTTFFDSSERSRIEGQLGMLAGNRQSRSFDEQMLRQERDIETTERILVDRQRADDPNSLTPAFPRPQPFIPMEERSTQDLVDRQRAADPAALTVTSPRPQPFIPMEERSNQDLVLRAGR